MWKQVGICFLLVVLGLLLSFCSFLWTGTDVVQGSSPLTSEAQVVLHHVQHVGHLREEQNLVVIGTEPLEQVVDQHQLGAGFNQVFP